MVQGPVISVLRQSKKHDKLFNFIVRVRCSKLGDTVIVMSAGIRLADAQAKLADCAHGPVLYLSKKQNRELQYASAFRASRVKETERSRYLDKQELSLIEITACEGSDGLRKEICQ